MPASGLRAPSKIPTPGGSRLRATTSPAPTSKLRAGAARVEKAPDEAKPAARRTATSNSTAQTQRAPVKRYDPNEHARKKKEAMERAAAIRLRRKAVAQPEGADETPAAPPPVVEQQREPVARPAAVSRTGLSAGPKKPYDPNEHARKKKEAMEKALALREQRKREQASREAAHEPPLEPAEATSTSSTSSPYSVGQAVEAKYSNGEWYDAVVVEISSHGHAVRFQDGFEISELSVDHIRTAAAPVAAKVASPVAAGLPSPEAPGAAQHETASAAVASNSAFAADDVVEARFSNGEWYTAVVLTVSEDGYGVRFEDGVELVLSEAELRANTLPEELQPAAQQPKLLQAVGVTPKLSAETTPAQQPAQAATASSGAASFKKGDGIEAKYSNGEWYDATVLSVTADGLYGVRFEDGVEIKELTEVHIRAAKTLEPPPKMKKAKPKPNKPVTKRADSSAAVRAVQNSSCAFDDEVPVGGPAAATRSSSPPLRPAAAAASSTVCNIGDFLVGEEVEARYSNGEWYDAVVLNADTVRFVDDGFEMPRTEARKKGAFHAPPAAPVKHTKAKPPKPAARADSSPPLRQNAAVDGPLPSGSATSASIDELPIGGSGFQMPSEFPLEQADGPAEAMAECPECGRCMRASVIDKHMVTHKKRKAFKSKNVDKEAKMAARTAAKLAPKVSKEDAAKAKAKKEQWKNQSTSLRDSIRAAREYQQAIARGEPPPPVVSSSAPDPSLVQCPHCKRRFNESAAERHIPKCNSNKNKKS